MKESSQSKEGRIMTLQEFMELLTQDGDRPRAKVMFRDEDERHWEVEGVRKARGGPGTVVCIRPQQYPDPAGRSST